MFLLEWIYKLLFGKDAVQNLEEKQLRPKAQRRPKRRKRRK